MTPDDKKRLEKIREIYFNHMSGHMMPTIDVPFLLAQLDEAHAALRDVATQSQMSLNQPKYHLTEEACEAIRKALGEE